MGTSLILFDRYLLDLSVDPKRFRSKSRNTPFGGRELRGRAATTIVRGRRRCPIIDSRQARSAVGSSLYTGTRAATSSASATRRSASGRRRRLWPEREAEVGGAEETAGCYPGRLRPLVYGYLHPGGHTNGTNPPALTQQVNDGPTAVALLNLLPA